MGQVMNIQQTGLGKDGHLNIQTNQKDETGTANYNGGFL